MENNYRASILQRIASILFSVSILTYSLPFVSMGWREVNGFELLGVAFSPDNNDIIYEFPNLFFAFVLLIVILALLITVSIIGYAANSKAALRTMGAFGISVVGLWILWFLLVAGEINDYDIFDLFSSLVEPMGGFWLFIGLISTATVFSFVAAANISAGAGRRYMGRAGDDDNEDYDDYENRRGYRRREPSIVCLSGIYKGAVFPIPKNEELIFGRDAALCHIVITDNAGKISRKHVTISYDPINDVYVVTDNSSNGTYLADGSRLVTNIPVRLRRGSIIYLAKRDNSFEFS